MDVNIYMPDIDLEEVEVTEILVKIGEKVEIEKGLIIVEGAKSSMEIPSSMIGVIKDIYVKIGDQVKTSSLIMTLIVNNISDHVDSSNNNILKNNDLLCNNKESVYTSSIVHATPLVRRLARKLNIDLNTISPSGRKKRILKEDIELYIQKHCIKNDNINLSQEKENILSYIQKNVARNLSHNWSNIPHVTQFDEINITVIDQFRQKYNKEHNSKITILVFILKVLAYGLERFPIFNSSLSKDKKKIILHEYINIGIAVDVNNDLLVPVLKNVNKKNILQISSELILISEKTRKKQLTKEDTNKSSFTVSSLGNIGGSWFTPIINAPEVSILGVSKALIKPVWNNTEFMPALMLPISLSYDHRVMNGAYAARFINFISKVLSDMHFLIM